MPVFSSIFFHFKFAVLTGSISEQLIIALRLKFPFKNSVITDELKKKLGELKVEIAQRAFASTKYYLRMKLVRNLFGTIAHKTSDLCSAVLIMNMSAVGVNSIKY